MCFVPGEGCGSWASSLQILTFLVTFIFLVRKYLVRTRLQAFSIIKILLWQTCWMFYRNRYLQSYVMLINVFMDIFHHFTTNDMTLKGNIQNLFDCLNALFFCVLRKSFRRMLLRPYSCRRMPKLSEFSSRLTWSRKNWPVSLWWSYSAKRSGQTMKL